MAESEEARQIEEEEEVERIAQEVINGKGSAKVKLQTDFKIKNIDSKVRKRIGEMGFTGAIKVEGKGGRNLHFSSNNFREAGSEIAAKPQKAPNVKPNYRGKWKINIPEINTNVQSIDELNAEWTKIVDFERQIKFAETPEEREFLRTKVRHIKTNLSGRSNEIRTNEALREMKRKNQEEHPSLVIRQPETELAPQRAAEKTAQETEAPQQNKKYARKKKSTLANDRDLIRTIGEHGSSPEEFAEMHAEAINKRELETELMRKELEQMRNEISLHEHEEINQEQISKMKHDYNVFLDSLKMKEEKLSALKEEKEALSRISLLNRPREKAGLAPTFFEKLFKESAKKREKTAEEQTRLAEMEKAEAKKFSALGKWRPRRKGK